MPRNPRCILPGIAYHITQRGTNRQTVFFRNADHTAYLRLLGENLAEAQVRLLAVNQGRDTLTLLSPPKTMAEYKQESITSPAKPWNINTTNSAD